MCRIARDFVRANTSAEPARLIDWFPMMQRFVVLLTVFTPILACAQQPRFQGTIQLPAIARYRELPLRMMDEVSLAKPSATEVLADGSIEFFLRILEQSKQPATQIQALDALADIARRELGDITPAMAAIQKAVKSPDRLVRQAAAGAVISTDARDAVGELLGLCESEDDRLRMRIEPVLARWKYEPATKMWQTRVTEQSGTRISISLACDGLAAVGAKNALDDLETLIRTANSFQARLAAGRAIATLEPERGLALFDEFASGDTTSRLIAATLLTGDDAECRKKLSLMSDDQSAAVAAKAWVTLEASEPELLRDKVDAGHAHRDTQVRLAAIGVMERFADEANCDRLAVMSGDAHIVVRNNARRTLTEFAAASDTLKSRIVSNAMDAVTKADSWQRVEQSLLIAAVQGQAQFTEKCVPLLTHKRPEVYATAAWLMHLFPNALVMDEVTDIATRRLKLFGQAPDEEKVDLGYQMASLFQLAGYLEHRPFQPLCNQQFSKNSGVTREGRAAAIWAIGMLNRNQPDKELISQLLRRLNDRSSPIPEFSLVRRMCVMALGRMQAKTESGQLRHAYKVDAPSTLIPEAVRWALGEFGAEVPPTRLLRDSVKEVGGWDLSPSSGD